MNTVPGRNGIWAGAEEAAAIRPVVPRIPDMPLLLALQSVQQNALPTIQAMRRARRWADLPGDAVSVMVYAFAHPADLPMARAAGLPMPNEGCFHPQVARMSAACRSEEPVNRAT